MKRSTSTRVAFGAFGLLVAMASCDDEGTDGGGEAGFTTRGGGSGKGGSDGGMGAIGAGRGGSSPTGGTPNPGTVEELGKACADDADCGSERLTCIRSNEISGGGPPGGLCTAECENDSDCNALSSRSACFRMSETLAICFEGCTVGPFSDPDCHERTEFACQGYETVGMGVECTVDDDCGTSEYCGNDGTCQQVLAACLPACNGDFQCDGAQCDTSSGFCSAEPTTGLPNGSICDPDATNDPCAGFCVGFGEDGGMCSSNCNISFAESCRVDANASVPAEAACLWSPLYADPTDIGSADPGFCGPLCDCADDCEFSDWTCFDGDREFLNGFRELLGRAGFCGPPSVGDPGSVLDCGVGGAGGQGPGASGSGGGGS